MTNSVLAKMAVMISANNAEFARVMSATRNDFKSFTSQLTSLAGKIGVAFGVREVAAFAVEISKLSGEAEAVNAAFTRLPNNTKLMQDLKQATGGTVSELELMKRSVQASNFDISLEALPKLLQFATLRAQQTGQSVDYLVDSIVTGIGRKSKLILDNLGISAVQLNEALGGVTTGVASIGDVADAVGKIAESNLKNMAGFSENASTKLQRLDASWQNMKVSIGDAANSTGVLGTVVDGLISSLDVAASKDLSFLEKIAAFGGGATGLTLAKQLEQIRQQQKINEEAKKQKQIVLEVDRAFKEFNGDIDAYGKVITNHIYKTELLAEFTKRLTEERKSEVTTVGDLNDKIKELNDLFLQTDSNDIKKLTSIGNEIIATQKLIDKLEALKKAKEGASLPKFGPPKIGSPRDDENPFPEFPAEEQSPIDIIFKDSSEKLNKERESVQGLAIDYYELSRQIEEANKKHALADEQLARSTQTAIQFGSTIGSAFGAAVSGQEDFGKAMQRLVPQLLGMFLSQAIGAQIAAGAEAGAESGNPVVGFALAAAGAAAIGSLFASATGYSGGSGGGGGLGSRQTVAGRFQVAPSREQRIAVEVSFKNGSLSAAIKNEQQRNSYTGG